MNKTGCARLLAGGALAGVVLGCQSYTPAPLDLEAYRSSLAERLLGAVEVEAFYEAGGGGAFDLRDGVTLAEGEALAMFYNPSLRLARLDALGAEARVENAGLWDDPVFGFDGAEVLSMSAPLEFGATIGFTLPVSGRLGLEEEHAESGQRVALERVRAREWAVRAAVRRAWVRWSLARGRAVLLGGLVEQTSEVAGITDGLEEAGEVPRVEARLVRAELAVRRMELVEARREERVARIDVLELLGLRVDAGLELAPTLAVGAGERSSVSEDAAVKASPRLAVRRAEYEAAEAALRVEIRKQYPDVSLGGGYGREEDAGRALVGVSIPIPVLNANRAGIAEARVARERARVGAEGELERLLADLARARERLASIREQREVYEREIVPMHDAQARELGRLIELGEVDTLLLLESVRRWYETRGRVLALRAGEADAAIEIAMLVGPVGFDEGGE